MGKLFGSSGVRGLVNSFLTPELACKVGMAVAAQCHVTNAVVARDTRVSGPMLEDALVAGLTASGVNVQLVGVVPTPAAAYLTRALAADVGFMLTASHNPPQYNGIKIFRATLSLTDEMQTTIENAITQNQYRLAPWQKVGTSRNVDAVNLYVDMLKQAAPLRKRWRVVVDPGCGATYSVAPTVLNQLGCQVTALNAQADGYFPARKSEPTAESLTTLSQTVTALGADLGIAFDGDGDRVAFVDGDGGFVDFDRALAGYAAYALKQTGGGTVVTNVEASMCVETMAAKFGGKVVRVRVGDVYVSEAMAQINSVFGGDPCGAWVHPRWHWCPDGPLSAVLMLKALEEQNQTLDEFIAEVPQYVTLRENLKCQNDQKTQIVTNLEKTIKQAFPDFTDYSNIDGVRLALKDGWVLVRASGTEPLIRLTVEGESLKAAQDIMQRGVALVKQQVGVA
jgi:phosphoglucosamine mutase